MRRAGKQGGRQTDRQTGRIERKGAERKQGRKRDGERGRTGLERKRWKARGGRERERQDGQPSQDAGQMDLDRGQAIIPTILTDSQPMTSLIQTYKRGVENSKKIY